MVLRLKVEPFSDFFVCFLGEMLQRVTILQRVTKDPKASTITNLKCSTQCKLATSASNKNPDPGIVNNVKSSVVCNLI